MLIKLMPEQVAKMWDVIKASMNSNTSPIAISEDQLMVALQKLLSGDMQCWVSTDDLAKEGKTINGIITTYLMDDEFSLTRSLLIYSFYTSRFGKKAWKEAKEVLSKYAKSKGCHHLSAYTTNTTIVQLCLKEGARMEAFLSLPLED